MTDIGFIPPYLSIVSLSLHLSITFFKNYIYIYILNWPLSLSFYLLPGRLKMSLMRLQSFINPFNINLWTWKTFFNVVEVFLKLILISTSLKKSYVNVPVNVRWMVMVSRFLKTKASGSVSFFFRWTSFPPPLFCPINSLDFFFYTFSDRLFFFSPLFFFLFVLMLIVCVHLWTMYMIVQV